MNIEQQKIEIKGILVNFFRIGTNGDYLESLNNAISEIQKVKNLSLSGVSKRFNRRSFIVGVGCGMAIGLSVALIILNVF